MGNKLCTSPDTHSEREKLLEKISDLERRLSEQNVAVERRRSEAETGRGRGERLEKEMIEREKSFGHERELLMGKLRDSISKASHEKKMEDIKREFAKRQEEIEERLALKFKRDLDLSGEADAAKQKEFRETLLQVRGGLKKLEGQRDSALKGRVEAEARVRETEYKLKEMEEGLKEMSEAKDVFRERLEETNANLGRLKEILEREKGEHLACQKESGEVKRKLAVKEEFLAKERGVLLEEVERTVLNFIFYF